MLPSTLIANIQSSQKTISISGISTQPKKLLKHFLEVFMSFTSISPLLNSIDHQFHIFSCNNGLNKVFTAHSLDSIIKYLIICKPPTHLVIPSYQHGPSSYFGKERLCTYGNQDKRLPYYTTPIYTKLDLGDPPNQQFEEHGTMEGLFFTYKSINDSLSDEDASNLVYAHMNEACRPTQLCPICDDHHDLDRCFTRGILLFSLHWLPKVHNSTMLKV